MKKKIVAFLLVSGLVLIVGCVKNTNHVEAGIPERFEIVETLGEQKASGKMLMAKELYIVRDKETGVKYWYGWDRNGNIFAPYSDGSEMQ